MDYRNYVLSRKEHLISLMMAALVLFLVGMLFFQHVFISFFISMAAWFYPKMYARAKQQRRQDELTLQFQQLLYVVSSSLSSGRSVESAFQSALKDLHLLYADPRTMIVQELQWMISKLQNGIAIERALREFSERAGIEDIADFAEVMVICKRQGGNLMEVVRKSASMITEKLDVQREILIITAQKKWESRLLSFTPLGFIAFLSVSSSDYMAPLYEGFGRVIMFFALMLLGVALWLSMKITNIRL